MKLRYLVLAGLLATEALAAQRVYVRSNGVDTGTCTLAAPCRGFTYAMSQVDAGGEVVALDAAGYGAVTISKSVTITTNAGFYAGISAATGDAILVDGAGVNVVLRGLAVNGVGAASGVRFVQGSTLSMENCLVSGFAEHGISIESPANVRILNTIVRDNGPFGGDYDGIWIGAGANAVLDGVRMSNNGRAGLTVDDSDAITTATVTNSDSFGSFLGYQAMTSGSGQARLSIRGSVASNSLYGMVAFGPAAYVAVGSSSASAGGVGFMNEGGTFESYGDNMLGQNFFGSTEGFIDLVGGN